MISIEADLHTHTVHSGHAYSTVDELARSAAKKGIKLIAITDHGPGMPGGPHEYYFNNMKVIPDRLYDVRIIKGIEANIREKGRLDLPQNTLRRLDFVAAGLHDNTGHSLSGKKDSTRAVVAAIENPLVDMITHPANKYFPVNVKKVVKAAKNHDVILEINASSFRKRGGRGDYKGSVELGKLARKYGVPLSLNSDAHFHTEVGDIKALNYTVRRAGLTVKDVINTHKEMVMERILFRKRNKKTG